MINTPKATMSYKIIYTLVVYLGAVGSLSAVWDFANFSNGLMVIPNVLSLLLLHNVVAAETKKYLWSGKLDENDPRCIRGNKLIEPEREK